MNCLVGGNFSRIESANIKKVNFWPELSKKEKDVHDFSSIDIINSLDSYIEKLFLMGIMGQSFYFLIIFFYRRLAAGYTKNENISIINNQIFFIAPLLCYSIVSDIIEKSDTENINEWINLKGLSSMSI